MNTIHRALAGLGLILLTAQAARADAPASPAPATPAGEGVVNINTATAEQLQLLPGIGETKARAIVAHRQRHPFARVEDLVAVRGIGRATLRRLRPRLAVRGDTTLTRRVAGAAPATASRPASPNAPPAARAR